MITTLDNLKFSYKEEIILSGVTESIADDDRIGLIGENGSGKTTLINLIVGRLTSDSGGVFTRRNLTIGYLEQNSFLDSELTVIAEMRTCFSSLLKMESRMREIEIEMSTIDHESREFNHISSEYNELKKRFEGLDGYNIDVKIKTVLNGMGFMNLQDRIVSSFSGGEKTRLAIAKLLLLNPELLILDEPTNHLDFETLMWLEEYLRGYKGAILIVSHDRFFLDKTVTKIWELEDKTLKSWRGNYTKYKLLKDEYLKVQLKEYEKQQVEIAKMEDYVNRNLVRATTAKSAQSRVKKLESLERIEKPKMFKKKPVFHFDKGIEPTKEVVRVNELTLYAGDKKLFEKGSFLTGRNEKVAIVGENGTGKSTLLRYIMSCYGEECKEVVWGKNVTISYYDQENLNLNFDNTVIGELWDKYPRYTLFDLRKILGRMLFDEVDIEKKISELSGGERARLGFAVMMLKDSNFLVMDEPTNHIDLETRETLEKAIVEFDGTVLFVSHDRYFLNAIADKIVKIGSDGIVEYKMSFDEYLEKRKTEKAIEVQQTQQVKSKEKNSSYKNTKERKEEARIKVEIKEVEAEISKLEELEAKINEEMQKPEIASNYEKLSICFKELEDVNKSMENAFEKWEMLNNKINL